MTLETLLADMKKAKPPVFTYLGEGVTTRAYLDPSKQFVLKILKTPEEAIERYKQGTGRDIKTDYSISDEAKDSNQLAAQEILQSVRDSLDLCWKALKEETGLLSIHRQGAPCDIDKFVIIDKEGDRQIIDGLENDCFFIQHKVDLLSDLPSDDDAKANQSYVKKGLDDWLAFQSMIWGRDIPMVNSDISQPHYNYGYLKSGKLCCIDVGGFSENPETISFQLKGHYVLLHKYADFMRDHGLHDYFKTRVKDIYGRGLKDYALKKTELSAEAGALGKIGFLKAPQSPSSKTHLATDRPSCTKGMNQA